MIGWGNTSGGIRFGLRYPEKESEAGGTVRLELLCENRSSGTIDVFGFRPDYPRSLRVSPPKTHRPHIRVSFGDVNVLHPPEAFIALRPGDMVSTTLDLSFAFDRRGAGRWPVAFAYDPVRTVGRRPAWCPPPGQGAETLVIDLIVTTVQALVECGVDAAAQEELDAALLGGHDVAEVLQKFGKGGPRFAARRVARILSSGSEAALGWKALDGLSLLKREGIAALNEARDQLPHAREALAFGVAWLRHQVGDAPAPEHLPFVHMLRQVIEQPSQRGNFILSWTPFDSTIHGTKRLQLLGSAERIVTTRAPGQIVATTRRLSLSPMQMKTVAEALHYSAVWLLKPLRANGMPDEPRPTLEIQLALGDPFVHSVAMWNGEWRLGPGSTIADLLDRLTDTSHSMLPPAP